MACYTTGVLAGSTKIVISVCLSDNVGIIQRIRKVLDESNGDYKGSIAWKFYSDDHDKKRTHEI